MKSHCCRDRMIIESHLPLKFVTWQDVLDTYLYVVFR